ncbi:MAG: hypothetical protein VYD05_04420 [Planctomycetota bacterium]|nr:hypothetical protein [Planctomycetota bacterium]
MQRSGHWGAVTLGCVGAIFAAACAAPHHAATAPPSHDTDAPASDRPAPPEAAANRGDAGVVAAVASRPRAPLGPDLRVQVGRHGISWTFSQPRRVGRYVNGDWWVIGPVSLVAITPACAAEGPRVRNGAMVNPDPRRAWHGYDSATAGSAECSRYADELNVARAVSPTSPLDLSPGSSLVSAVSHPTPGQLPQLERCAVLTVVAAAPPPRAFRPPYCGADKRARWSAKDLDETCLHRLPRVAGAPSTGELLTQLEHTWLDHLSGLPGRYLHPRENMPDYGRDIADVVGAAALALNLDLPIDEKRALLVVLVQLGIDVYGIVKHGGRFRADGAAGSGRKLPMMLAGQLLRDRDILETAVRASSAFGEDAQTFFVTETSPGVINGGHGGYVDADVGLPEWGNRHADDPSSDRKGWSADPYRRCCTANSWVGFVLAARIMGLREAWGHPALFEYVDRYMQIERPGHWMRSWNPFAERMWERYRADF